MEVKKSEKANLENKRFIFKEIGFVVVLLVILGAFELGISESNTVIDRSGAIAEDDVEMVEVTREEQQPEPEPPKPDLPEPPQSESIEEVEDPEEDQSDKLKANDDDVNSEVQQQDYGFGEDEEVEEKVHTGLMLALLRCTSEIWMKDI